MKTINPPSGIEGIAEMTPLQLNAYRFSGVMTPLTPEQIEQLAPKS